MKKAACLLFPSQPPGIPSVAENSNDRMSVAQKEWPVRGRILMARISKTNEDALEKKPLADSVALVTGGEPGDRQGVGPQFANSGGSNLTFGAGVAPLPGS